MDTRRVSAIRASLGPLLVIAVWGCAPPSLQVHPVRYEVEARLDPGTHTLQAAASLDLERLAEGPPARRVIELRLHPGLAVDAVELEGARLLAHRRRRGRPVGDGIAPTIHRLIVADPQPRVRVTLGYRGTLVQDVEAGEKEGEIHNLAVSAHVDGEGLYLEPAGYWYPRVEPPRDADPELSLAHYRLDVDPIEGFELVAGLERDPATDDGALRWSSRFPIEGLVLLGGPLERRSRRHGGVELHAVLAPGKGEVAEDVLDASAEYLDRYLELIGPYPFREFTVLEAFFSSGFAFPGCTQIAGSQLSEFKQYRRHGYLDHELLHNWWGNGIYADPRDGNWVEGLASYAGNYYGYVLDGDDGGARKQRRNYSNFLSALDDDEDRPLGTFGLDDGAGRSIGYFKAASVFHMLERKIGEEAFFAALRRLTDERMGRFASWEHLRSAFERASGADLGGFFEQWVRRPGAPRLGLADARWETESGRLIVRIEQGEPAFDLDVPLRLHYGDRFEDVVVAIDRATQEVEVPGGAGAPTAVELDPDYHVFRRLKPSEAMPTSSLTRGGERLLIVIPDGDPWPGYRTLVEGYTRAVLGEGNDANEGREVLVRRATEIEPGELTRGNVLVVGEAVRAAAVRDLLARSRTPVAWSEGSFAVEGEVYDRPGQAIFFTVHHPDRDDAGITVYYGNGAEALANARLLGYYANSLLVFETPAGDPDGETPRTEVLRRIDFEFHDRIELGEDGPPS